MTLCIALVINFLFEFLLDASKSYDQDWLSSPQIHKFKKIEQAAHEKGAKILKIPMRGFQVYLWNNIISKTTLCHFGCLWWPYFIQNKTVIQWIPGSLLWLFVSSRITRNLKWESWHKFRNVKTSLICRKTNKQNWAYDIVCLEMATNLLMNYIQ